MEDSLIEEVVSPGAVVRASSALMDLLDKLTSGPHPGRFELVQKAVNTNPVELVRHFFPKEVKRSVLGWEVCISPHEDYILKKGGYTLVIASTSSVGGPRGVCLRGASGQIASWAMPHTNPRDDLIRAVRTANSYLELNR